MLQAEYELGECDRLARLNATRAISFLWVRTSQASHVEKGSTALQHASQAMCNSTDKNMQSDGGT